MDASESIGTIAEIVGTEFRIRLPDGRTVTASLDAARLRAAHGPLYGFSVGDKVLVELESPPRITFLITYAASRVGEE